VAEGRTDGSAEIRVSKKEADDNVRCKKKKNGKMKTKKKNGKMKKKNKKKNCWPKRSATILADSPGSAAV
jgi:hypothetical protein